MIDFRNDIKTYKELYFSLLSWHQLRSEVCMKSGDLEWCSCGRCYRWKVFSRVVVWNVATAHLTDRGGCWNVILTMPLICFILCDGQLPIEQNTLFIDCDPWNVGTGWNLRDHLVKIFLFWLLRKQKPRKKWIGFPEASWFSCAF